MCYILLRMFQCFKLQLFYLVLFNAFVRPDLEYASVLWSPYQTKCKIQIEKFTTNLRIAAYKTYNQYPSMS